MLKLRFYLPVLLAVIVLTSCTKQKPELKSIQDRISDRDFPSIFQAWGEADNLPDEDSLTTMARHDLVFMSIRSTGLKSNNSYEGLADGFVPNSIERALKFKHELLAKNPNALLLVEIRYRDAHKSFLPKDHPWWMYDEKKQIVPGWEEGGYMRMNFMDSTYRQHVSQRAKAAIETGVADGIMLDWWNESKNTEARLALVKTIREAIGPSALIMVNSNDRKIPLSAPYVNGLFMECYRSDEAWNWDSIQSTLMWAEEHLRAPQINCLESWYHTSRNDLYLMRATTCMALVSSNGYALFSDPNSLPTPDHLHNWYPFWNASLGKPTAKGYRRDDNAWQRDFEKGIAVYNPMSNQPVRLHFEQEVKRLSTGESGKEFTMPELDGDIFLKQE